MITITLVTEVNTITITDCHHILTTNISLLTPSSKGCCEKLRQRIIFVMLELLYLG